ncbi:hypothetical protein CDL15_Pgr014446 [Punica granatum]|uniref:Uncharacterized protein n=1 Tax=Punica granatum TaxID=22663 RepID=A0A218WE10_PUNGR|nr:hypothetical protein CDL15_Pgr014446 [Punica granatum]PKI41711.1 hypothetical protein CRG98_037913 [Punica granatum]
MGKGNVPFSWEDMPGISKSGANQKPYSPAANKLPPPPCPRSRFTRKLPFHEMQNIPLPPCAFQPPLPAAPPQRSSSKKGVQKDDDPFLAAYRECTKSSKEANKSSKHHGARSGLRKHVSCLSCKRSCSVRDGNFVRISHSDS